MAAKPSSTNEDRIAKAASYKEEGNGYFAKKEYKKATKKYHFALLQLRGIGEKNPITGEQDKLSEEMEKRLLEGKFGCYNNLAGKATNVSVLLALVRIFRVLCIAQSLTILR